MLKGINWKFYLIFAAAVTVVSFFFSWKIAVGFILGTGCYFLNMFLAEKKFPSLDLKAKAIAGALGVIAVQGFITIVMAIVTWFIGNFSCFLAGFAAMIIPNFYFIIRNLIK